MSSLDQRQVYQLIEQVAGQANILTIPRLFIDWTGDHIAALLLSQIIYWSSRTRDPEGWFYKSAKDWEEELGISDYQLARATKNLAEAGVRTKLRKVNGAPTQHYRIDQVVFGNWISEKLGNGFPSPPTMDLPETEASLTETTNRDHDQRDDFETSNGRHPVFADDDRLREALLPFADDFGREFADQAPLAATLSRLVNLYKQSGREMDDYIEVLYRARRITKERSAAIRGTAATARGKAKMGYFFGVLQDALQEPST